MQTLQHKTVIVGSGFAGRTVAQHLEPGSYVILERGEDRSHAETIKRYDRAREEGLPLLEAEARAYQSDRPWNRFERLSRYCCSNFAMVRGGASNWWGGKATRLSPAVFNSTDGLPWALTEAEMRPWYERAERRLNLAGDPLAGKSTELAPIEGALHWRNAFQPHFSASGLYAVAINKRQAPATATGQGFCEGRGHCAVCKEDAKARPDNIFTEHPTLYDAFVQEIEFSGDTAQAVQVFDGRQLYRIECERVVVAANGVESPRLLARSDLPAGVNRSALGRFCQDHAHVEFECWIPSELAYGALGGLSHVQIPELTRMYPSRFGPIEASALAITHEPPSRTLESALDINWLREGGIAMARSRLRGTFVIHVELETVMHIDAQVDLDAEVAAIDDRRYPELVEEFDGVVLRMQEILQQRGVKVLRTLPHYRAAYGGHHFVGTTNWSRSGHNMLEDDLRLGGTRNVYMAGASVIPRAGGVAPTLTLVALAERLGTHLAGLDTAPDCPAVQPCPDLAA